MGVSTDVFAWLSFLSALLVVGTGLAVGRIGHFRGFNLAFMLFWTGWGTIIALQSAFNVFDALRLQGWGWTSPALAWFVMPATMSMVAGALWIVAKFPDGRWASWGTWMLVVALVAGLVMAELQRTLWVPSFDVVMNGNNVASALMIAAAAGLALRFPGLVADSPATATQAALVAAGLAIYPGAFFAFAGFGASGWLAEAAGIDDFPVSIWTSAWAVASSILLSVLWFRASILTGEDPRARRVAIWVLVPALAGLVDSAFFVAVSPSGVARLATLAVFGYAIVRHQLYGIDVKVRWTLSRSTLAAGYVALFFVVTEGAQQFLDERTNSAYLGIVVVGLLLFAVGPLHRLADSFATRAVPVASRNTRGIYLDMAHRLAADGELSAEDHRRLAHLADQLGLGAGAAHDLQTEVAASSRTK